MPRVNLRIYLDYVRDKYSNMGIPVVNLRIYLDYVREILKYRYIFILGVNKLASCKKLCITIFLRIAQSHSVTKVR